MPDIRIPIASHAIGATTRPGVSARHLHDTLGIKKHFTEWLEQYTTSDDWRKDNDFSVFPLEVKNLEGGGRPGIDAALSVQMAEHIAMMTKTKKGREVREYFRQARDDRDAQLPATRGDILVQMAEAYRVQERRIVAIEADHQAQQNAIIASQAKAIEALQQAARAEQKADLAFDNQNFWTVAEYVQYHDLRHQCPVSAYAEASRHLSQYCRRERLNYRDPAVLPRRIPVGERNWETEWGFHTSIYEAAFLPWLLRRQGQGHLQIVAPQVAP